MEASKADIELACQIVYEYYTGESCLSRGYTWLRLSHSRDAWHEHIFPMMDEGQLYAFDCQIVDICIFTKDKFTWQAEPLDLLEAALKAAGLWDKWKEGCK